MNFTDILLTNIDWGSSSSLGQVTECERGTWSIWVEGNELFQHISLLLVSAVNFCCVKCDLSSWTSFWSSKGFPLTIWSIALHYPSFRGVLCWKLLSCWRLKRDWGGVMGFSDKCMHTHSTLIVQVQVSNSRQILACVHLTLFFVNSWSCLCRYPWTTRSRGLLYVLSHAFCLHSCNLLGKDFPAEP